MKRKLPEHIERLHAPLQVWDYVFWLLDKNERLQKALTDIADADYRGNRSPESQAAHDALAREGLRPE